MSESGWNVDDKTGYAATSRSLNAAQPREVHVWINAFSTYGWNRTDVALTANVTHIFTPALVNETMLNTRKDEVQQRTRDRSVSDKVDRT